MRAYGILFFCALGWFFLQSSHVAGADVRSSFVSLMDSAKSGNPQRSGVTDTDLSSTNGGSTSKKKDGELKGEDLVKELRRECEQRKKQNETDAATINKLNKEITSLKAENKKLNARVTELESSKDDDASSSDSFLEEENESLRDNINTLREQLAEYKHAAKKRSEQPEVDDKKKPEEETTSAGVATRWQTLLLGGGVLLIVLLLLLQGAKIRKLAKPMVRTAEGGAPQLTKKEQQKVAQEQVEAIQKLLADWEGRFQETLVHFSQQQEKRQTEERNIPVTEYRTPVVEAKQKPPVATVSQSSKQPEKSKVAYGHFLFAEGLRSDNSFDRVDPNRNDYKKFVLKLRAKGDTRAAFALNEQSNQKTQWIAQPSQYLFNEACELVGRLPEVRSQIEIVEEGEAILENGKWYVIKKLSFRLV